MTSLTATVGAPATSFPVDGLATAAAEGGHVQVSVTDAGSRVVLDGRLDVHCAADVRAVLLRALDGGAGDLVVDLAAVPGVDPTGLGALLEAHRRAQRLGRRLVLLDVPPALWRLVLRTRLHRVLAVERSAAEVA